MNLDCLLTELPVAVLDFETTGLSPKAGCRVVEVSVVRCEPKRDPVVSLDTLVNPQGPVLCTNIHGITDEDVIGAPLFSDIGDDLVRSLQGAVVGEFNASFDMTFYSAEMRAFQRGRTVRMPPHVCLMWLRPLLGVGKRCSLSAACQELGIAQTSHRAAEDALAASYVWRHYLDAASAKGIRTLRDLRKAGTHTYLDSLEAEAYSAADLAAIGQEPTITALKPRVDPIHNPIARQPEVKPSPYDHAAAIRTYWQDICASFSDKVITPSEVEALRAEQQRLGLPAPSIRSVHARFFADRLMQAAEDDSVSSSETLMLSQLHAALAALGWGQVHTRKPWRSNLRCTRRPPLGMPFRGRW